MMEKQKIDSIREEFKTAKESGFTSVPDDLITAIPALLDEIECLQAETLELKIRLELNPCGDDKIDALEQALEYSNIYTEQKYAELATLKKALDLACEDIAKHVVNQKNPNASHSLPEVADNWRRLFIQQAKRIQNIK